MKREETNAYLLDLIERLEEDAKAYRNAQQRVTNDLARRILALEGGRPAHPYLRGKALENL